jgi:hypothetical protein
MGESTAGSNTPALIASSQLFPLSESDGRCFRLKSVCVRCVSGWGEGDDEDKEGKAGELGGRMTLRTFSFGQRQPRAASDKIPAGVPAIRGNGKSTEPLTHPQSSRFQSTIIDHP